jgi:Holliday junction DNA helicase RuvA
MIAKLTGVVDSLEAEGAVIDVAGVGYLVFCSRRTLGRLSVGERAALLVETHVREDHIHLYGFLDTAERGWFRLLTTVQGVGGRVALAVLGVLDPQQLATAIFAQDRAAIARAEGIGPKLAGRIVAELKDKAGTLALGPAEPVPAGGAPAAGGAGPAADAVSALENLGYGRSEAYAAVSGAADRLGGGAAVEVLIGEALKALAAK